MLSFPIASVQDVISRGKADAAANGGFRDPQFGLSDADNQKPGLWLVGDHGVYLMSNGILAEGTKPLVVYAEECDPNRSDDWFEVKRSTFGGDDGVDFIDAEGLEAMMVAAPCCTHLSISFEADAMTLSLVTRP